MEISKQGALPDSGFLDRSSLRLASNKEETPVKTRATQRGAKSFHEKPNISLTPKQVARMVEDLFSASSVTGKKEELKRCAAQNPELFRQAILKMLDKADCVEKTWDKAIEIAEILSLSKSSRSSSQPSFADELKMEINTQRFIRDLTWHVKNAGFAGEDFSMRSLDFRRFALPRDQSVTKNALMKILSPDGLFGSFGLDLALKFTADTGLESLHAQFNSYKDALADLKPGGGKIDYRASTDNHAQNHIRHLISHKVSPRNPAYNTLIQLFMMPNSLLPNDEAKKSFLEEANGHYHEFANNLPLCVSNDYPLIRSKPLHDLVKRMIPLIEKHFKKNALGQKFEELLKDLAEGGTARLAVPLPKKYKGVLVPVTEQR